MRAPCARLEVLVSFTAARVCERVPSPTLSTRAAFFLLDPPTLPPLMSSTPGGGAGDSRRRAEIEAKRAKLAELRRAREERSSRIHAGRTTSSSLSGAGTGAAGSSEADTPLSSHRKDLDDLVATLVGPSGSASPRKSLGPGVVGGGGDDHPSDGSGRPSVGVPSSSDYAESAAGTAATGGGTTLVSRADGEIAGVVGSRGMPDMIDVETELFEFPQKVGGSEAESEGTKLTNCYLFDRRATGESILYQRSANYINGSSRPRRRLR